MKHLEQYLAQSRPSVSVYHHDDEEEEDVYFTDEEAEAW